MRSKSARPPNLKATRSKSARLPNLKALLIKHLSGKEIPQKPLTVHALADEQLKISDNRGYFLTSANLKKHISKDKALRQALLLRNWRFVTRRAAKRGSAGEIDIEAETVKTVPFKGKFFITGKSRDVLTTKPVRRLMDEADRLAGKSKIAKLKTTARARVVGRAMWDGAESVTKGKKPVPIVVPLVKRIAKTTQKVPEKKTNDSADEPSEDGIAADVEGYSSNFLGRLSQVNGHSPVSKSAHMNGGASNKPADFDPDISATDLIEAPNFVPFRRKGATNKPVKFSPAKKSQPAKSNSDPQGFLSAFQRKALAQVVSDVPKNSVLAFREDIDPRLQNNAVNLKDILTGLATAKVSWKELYFSAKAYEHLKNNWENFDNAHNLN